MEGGQPAGGAAVRLTRTGCAGVHLVCGRPMRRILATQPPKRVTTCDWPGTASLHPVARVGSGRGDGGTRENGALQHFAVTRHRHCHPAAAPLPRDWSCTPGCAAKSCLPSVAGGGVAGGSVLWPFTEVRVCPPLRSHRRSRRTKSALCLSLASSSRRRQLCLCRCLGQPPCLCLPPRAGLRSLHTALGASTACLWATLPPTWATPP